MAPGVVILNDMNMNVPVAKERSLRNTIIARDFGITMCTLLAMFVANLAPVLIVCSAALVRGTGKTLEDLERLKTVLINSRKRR